MNNVYFEINGSGIKSSEFDFSPKNCFNMIKVCASTINTLKKTINLESFNRMINSFNEELSRVYFRIMMGLDYSNNFLKFYESNISTIFCIDSNYKLIADEEQLKKLFEVERFTDFIVALYSTIILLSTGLTGDIEHIFSIDDIVRIINNE